MDFENDGGKGNQTYNYDYDNSQQYQDYNNNTQPLPQDQGYDGQYDYGNEADYNPYDLGKADGADPYADYEPSGYDNNDEYEPKDRGQSEAVTKQIDNDMNFDKMLESRGKSIADASDDILTVKKKGASMKIVEESKGTDQDMIEPQGSGLEKSKTMKSSASTSDISETQSRRTTFSSKIKVSDGLMKLYISGLETKGSGTSKHNVYRIKGSDSLGEIDIMRRYREFDQFRDLLFLRYPGIFIPPLPPKQNHGKTENLFVQERQYFLNEFLKKLCTYPYLVSTPEVQVFIRPEGKFEDGIKALSRPNTDMLLDFFQRKIKCLDHNIDESRVSQYNLEIHAFVKDQKAIMDHLKSFKEHINKIVPMKYQELRYYKQFADFLLKFEEGSAEENKSAVGTKEDKTIRLVAGDTKAHLKNKLDDLADQLTNPFVHVRNWVKSEMLNLGALIAAIGEKESCDHRKQQTIKKLAEDRELCEKINANKFSLKTMFKSRGGKDRKQVELLANIQQRERDIANWDEIKRFLTVYLAEIAIPDFKKRKMFQYISAMQNFSGDELQNAEHHQNCWKDFYELTKAYPTD